MVFVPRFSRRRVLQALAGTAVGGLLPSLRFAAARNPNAVEDGIPLRMLFLHVHSGMLRGHWEARGANGAPAPTRTAFELGPLMQPLTPFQDRMTVFKNLDMVSCLHDAYQTGRGGHDAGAAHALVGAHRLDRFAASDISVDQFIAREINADAPVTFLPSIEMAAKFGISGSISWAGPGEEVPYLRDCQEIWDRLFPEPLDENAALGAQRTSVYNLIKGEHERLMADLSTAERQKIERHLDERADLHARLNLVNERAGFRPPETVLDPFHAVPEPVWDHEEQYWQAMVDVQAALTVAALHTDTTRVASFQIQQAPGSSWGYANGDFGTNDWHDLDHQVSNPNNDLPSEATQLLTSMQSHSVDQCAKVLEMLQDRTELDGSSMLDHTLVLICGHIGDGSHQTWDLPWIVLGDAHGFLQTGQYLEFARENASDDRSEGKPHNDLLVTLAQAMGVDVETFGNPEVCTGPLTEMHA